jgi:hypothetical protein
MSTLGFDYERIASLEIERDSDPLNPRDWDNLGVMACWHKRYKLGDVQPTESGPEWLKHNAPRGSVVLPIYMMDHSGLSFSTFPSQFYAADPQGWDWGKLGVIIATPDAIRKAYQVKRITKGIRQRAEAALRQEVKTYDDFHNGNVWGYTITDHEGADDSCWGFFGSELKETGLEDAIPEHARPLLADAWEARK